MAGSEIKVFSRIRRLLEGLDQSSVGNDEQQTLSEQLEGLVALGSSPYEETVKLGRAFEVHTTTAVASVQALPTTVSGLTIQNMEPDAGRSYIIDRVWGLRIGSTTAIASQAALIGCLGQTKIVAALGAASGLPLNPLNGNAGQDSKVKSFLTAVALDAATGVAGNWRVLPGQTGGLKISAGAATVGGDFINADVNGRLIVPPGHVFGVHVISPLAAETFQLGIEWHEKVIRLG